MGWMRENFFFKRLYLFIYGCAGSLLLCPGFLSLQTVRAALSLWYIWLLLLWSMCSRARGLQQLWCLGLVALWHVGSS